LLQFGEACPEPAQAIENIQPDFFRYVFKSAGFNRSPTKTRAKQTKIEQIQKTESFAILRLAKGFSRIFHQIPKRRFNLFKTAAFR